MTTPVNINGQWVVVSPMTGNTHACPTEKAARVLADSLAQKHAEAQRLGSGR